MTIIDLYSIVFRGTALCEFPKGIKMDKEGDIDAALRELEEETQIKKDSVKILEKNPISYTFTGSDSLIYTVNYFVGLLKIAEGETIKRSAFIDEVGCSNTLNSTSQSESMRQGRITLDFVRSKWAPTKKSSNLSLRGSFISEEIRDVKWVGERDIEKTVNAAQTYCYKLALEKINKHFNFE